MNNVSDAYSEYRACVDEIQELRSRLCSLETRRNKLLATLSNAPCLKNAGFNIPLKTLGLSHRVHNSLARVGVKTVGDLVELLNSNGSDVVSFVPNFGETSLDEVREKLSNLAIQLAGSAFS